jgi:glycerol-3-phosphate dehydrogenase subunit C
MSSVRETLDHCVKCTICETYCPFAQATPLFPGPKYVGPQGERFRGTDGSADVSLDYCSGCGICTQVCPQGVKIAEINSQARAELWQERGIPLRNRLIARPSVTGALGTPLAPLANLTLRAPPVRWALERTLGIDRRAPLPRFAGRTFRAWARHHARRTPEWAGTVVYFHGCGTNYYEPRTGERVVRVLEHNGFRVVVPKQGCCGLPLQSNGDFAAARRYVRALAAALDTAGEGAPIVTNSTSCGLMLKREALEILEIDDEALRRVSERTYDICEFLLGLHERGEFRLGFEPLPITVPYHAPCQQRGHGIGKPALELLALIPQLGLVELDAACCGIAGTYGLKREKYEIAMRVGEDLFAQVRAAEPDVTACDSETCRWQITHATGVPSVHPIELLHRAYGLERRW